MQSCVISFLFWLVVSLVPWARAFRPWLGVDSHIHVSFPHWHAYAAAEQRAGQPAMSWQWLCACVTQVHQHEMQLAALFYAFHTLCVTAVLLLCCTGASALFVQ